MRGRLKMAFCCHLVVALGFAATGVLYLASPRFMPYHARVAGAPWEALPEATRTLLSAFMRGSGAATLAVAAAVALLLWIPFRRGERWARHAVVAVGLCATLPLLALILWLEAKTGAETPWMLVSAAVALQLMGWAASLGCDGSARQP